MDHGAAGAATWLREGRRRTIDPDQLALALHGELDTVYAPHSFIATNLPHRHPAHTVAVEAWCRPCTDIEDREAKHGSALRHLPEVISSSSLDQASELGNAWWTV